MNSYDQGDVVTLTTVTRKLVNGVQTETDPTGLKLKVILPDDSVVLYTWPGGDLVRDSQGIFHADVLILVSDESGVWTYRWEATGAVTAADEKQFYVRQASA